MAVNYRDKNDPLATLLRHGAPVLVVGLGASGLSAANLLAGMGCSVEVNDKSLPENTVVDLSHLDPSITVHWDGHPVDLFKRFPLIIISPGIPFDLEVLRIAAESGAKIIGEMELAFRLTSAPWVAITGSNGNPRP